MQNVRRIYLALIKLMPKRWHRNVGTGKEFIFYPHNFTSVSKPDCMTKFGWFAFGDHSEQSEKSVKNQNAAFMQGG